MEALIAGIISAVVAIASSVTGYVLTAKEVAKEKINRIMYQQVYELGVSFESVKQTNIQLYRNNKKAFNELYDYYAGKREEDMRNGTHTQQKKIIQNRMLSIILLFIIAVVIFMIVLTLKKKK